MHTDYLNSVEKALEAVLRRHAGRELPARARAQIANLLVDAMRHSIRREVDGSWVAPNVFYLLAHPSLAKMLKNPALLDDLSEVLWMGGRQQRLRFPSRPVIHLQANPQPGNPPLVVKAHINLDAAAEAPFLVRIASEQTETIPQNAFLIVERSQVFRLNRPLINIGRRLDNHLVLDDPRVSRAHAQIRVQHGRFVIHDLSSTGGTYVNGKRITGSCVLQPGDVISLAGVALVFGQDVPPARDEYTRPFPPVPAGDENTQVADDKRTP